MLKLTSNSNNAQKEKQQIYCASAILLFLALWFAIESVWGLLATRFVVGFVPLVLSVVFGAIVIIKGYGNNMRECAGLCNVASYIVMQKIVLDITGLNFYLSDCTLVAIYALSMMFVFRSKFACGFTIAYTTAIQYSLFELWFISVALVLIWVFTMWNWKNATTSQVLLFVVVCVCSLYIFAKYPSMLIQLGGADAPCGFVYYETQMSIYGVGVVLLLMGTFGRFANVGYDKQPYVAFGIILMSVAFGYLNTEKCPKENILSLLVKMSEQSTLSASLLLLFFGGLLLAWGIMFYKSLQAEKKYLGMSVLSTMFPIFVIFSLFGKDASFVFMLIANIVYFISACLFVFVGVKRKNKEMVKVGVLMFGYQAMFRVIILGVEIPTKMIISIGVIALIVVNYIINKSMGVENEK